MTMTITSCRLIYLSPPFCCLPWLVRTLWFLLPSSSCLPFLQFHLSAQANIPRLLWLQDTFNALFPANPQTGEIEFTTFVDTNVSANQGMKWSNPT
jgi:hypothetical protein